MNKSLKTAACLLTLSLLQPLAGGSVLASVLPDTLNKPAVATELAHRTMLADLTRAGQRLVAVGERGHIILSDDEGNSWRQASVPVSVTLTAVCFADELNGWATGHRGAILATADGGETWNLQLDGNGVAAALLKDAQARDPQLVMSAERLVEDGADKPLLAIHCQSASQALAVGAFGMAVMTRDGGQSWQGLSAVLEATSERHLNYLLEHDDGLYIAGEMGGLFRLDQQGHAHNLDEPYEGSFFALTDTRDGNLLAFGLRGHLFRSSDTGQSWQPVMLDATQSLTAGTRLPDGRVLITDVSGTGWLSDDNGHSFSRVRPERQYPFTALLPIADGRVLAVGQRGITWFKPEGLR